MRFEIVWPLVLKYCRNGKGESKRAALASLLIRDSSEQVKASSNNANDVGGQRRAATVRLSISSLAASIFTVVVPVVLCDTSDISALPPRQS
jgi:hypothetical protein